MPKSEQPPPRPPNAYILFFTRLTRSQPEKIKSLTETHAVAKQASAAWKALTLAEKQVIYDDVLEMRSTKSFLTALLRRS